MLSFRTMMDVAAAKGVEARIGFRIGEQTFVIGLRDGRIDLDRAPLDDVDLVFSGTTAAIAAAPYGGVPLADLEARGELGIEGDRALAERFVTWFPLPPKAEAPAGS
jgi:hypothetical protein